MYWHLNHIAYARMSKCGRGSIDGRSHQPAQHITELDVFLDIIPTPTPTRMYTIVISSSRRRIFECPHCHSPIRDREH
jgi:hypothetical protein